MSGRLLRFLLWSGLGGLLAACDPNVVIGARWNVDQGFAAGQAGSGAAQVSGAGGIGAFASGGTETVVAGSSGASDGGAAGTAGGAPATGPEWCATAPWVNNPVRFTSEDGDAIPAGDYRITYLSGAQIHDPEIGYEVTRHYYIKTTIEAGHHVFSGESPETGATSLWLDQEGIVGFGGTVAEVEAANRGHTWPLEHAGGELYVTLYDDDYRDNSGPGSRFCITAAAP